MKVLPRCKSNASRRNETKNSIRAATVLSLLLLLAQPPGCLSSKISKANDIVITSYRNEYDNFANQQDLIHDKASDFNFERFQSPLTIQRALKHTHRKSPSKWYQGKDGRKGFVSSTKLVGDWVLAESQQVAMECTAKEVLEAYLSGDLQQQWNNKEVLECTFREITRRKKSKSAPAARSNILTEEGGGNFVQRLSSKLSSVNKVETETAGISGMGISKELHGNKSKSKISAPRLNTKSDQIEKCYQQDLVLKSQRIIRSQTGIMRYSQIITIDKIGHDSYSVLVHLDPDRQGSKTTMKKPFEALSVYVGLQQNGKNVDIYAAGVMKVNRKVVPNLIVFDASGIAGGMAGKGTLWLAGFFDQRHKNRMHKNRIRSGFEE